MEKSSSYRRRHQATLDSLSDEVDAAIQPESIDLFDPVAQPHNGRSISHRSRSRKRVAFAI